MGLHQEGFDREGGLRGEGFDEEGDCTKRASVGKGTAQSGLP